MTSYLRRANAILARRCHIVILTAHLALLLLVLGPSLAAAHALDVGYLRIEPVGTHRRITLDLDTTAAAQLLGVPTLTLAHAPALAAATYARSIPAACTLVGPPRAEFVGVTARLVATLACPAGSVTWDLPFVRDIAATFELLVKDGEQLVVVDRNAPRITLAPLASLAPHTRRRRPNATPYLIGGLLAGLVLAPLAHLALRRSLLR